MLKKIYFELLAIRQELQELREVQVVQQKKQMVEKTTYYANNQPAEIIIALKMDGTLNAEGIRKVIDKVNEQLEGLENSPQVKYIFK